MAAMSRSDARVLVNNLTNTARLIFPAGPPENPDSRRVVSHILIAGGAVRHRLVFRGQNGGAIYLRCWAPAADNAEISGFVTAPIGLEVISEDAAGDVHVTVVYDG